MDNNEFIEIEIDLGKKYNYIKEFRFDDIRYINTAFTEVGEPHDITFANLMQALSEAAKRVTP